MFLILASVLLLSAFDLSLSSTTPCNQLSKENIDLEDLIKQNAMFVYRSSWPIFQCSVVNHVKPLLNDENYSATAMFSQGSTAFNFRLILTNNNLWNATYCAKGNSASYTNALVKLDDANSVLLVVSCDGARYKIVIGFGKSASDEEIIDNFIEKHEIPEILNTYKGCNYGNNFCPVSEPPVKRTDD